MRSTSATTFLLESLKNLNLLREAPTPWVVAYSGGRDSTVLLWALQALAPPGLVEALHVDHGWRPAAERAEELALCRDFCSSLGVPLSAFGPPERPLDPGEAAARAYRYTCFRSFLNQRGVASILLAHHADDQAETILMRLLKGRSWQGLAGMPAQRGRFLRPLLEVRAAVLAEVAQEQNLPYHFDSTNLNASFLRNHLRLTVFPLLKASFPRAVEALVDFSKIWAQVVPRAEPDSRWKFLPQGAEVPIDHWDSWSVLEKQAQLLAVAAQIAPGTVLARRFLEALSRPDRRSSAQGAGWSWVRRTGWVRWERVVHRSSKEYFILAMRDRWYDVGDYRLSWSPVKSDGSGGLWIPGIDPGVSLVWRSPAAGMRWVSADDPDWGKAKRRRRLGNLSPGRCALLIQGGLIRAVVDPHQKSVLWQESDPEKLNKTGIFVTLVRVTDQTTEKL